ncbi:MAG: ATP synthase subunit I [Cyanobacteria bacterium J06632_22]
MTSSESVEPANSELAEVPDVEASADEVSVDSTEDADEGAIAPSLPPTPDSSMQGYYKLQQDLLKYTLLATAVIFGFVWAFYSLQTALNYLIGACTGVVYLRMLAKNVAELGRQRSKVGSGRLALFIGLIVLSTQWNQLQIMPVFLGFLTYKASLMGYTLWAALMPEAVNQE